MTLKNDIDRILIVGLGSIGQRHLRVIRNLMPSAEVASLRHSRAGDDSDHVDKTFYEISDAIEFAPQIAVITNPSTFHLNVAIPLAENGIHLLVEKPLSDTSQNILKLEKSCRTNNVRLAVGYNLRFLESLIEFKRLVQEKTLGEVWSIRCEVGQYLPSWRPDADYRDCVSANQDLGGGVLLELSHEIDYLQWLFGPVLWVQASLSKQSSLELDVEDTAHLLLGFDGHLSGKDLIANLNMDFLRHDATRVCTLICERGSLRWDGINGTVELYEVETSTWKCVFIKKTGRDDSYISEWNNFLSCVASEKEPAVTIGDGHRVLQVVDAARLSSNNMTRTYISDSVTLSGS